MIAKTTNHPPILYSCDFAAKKFQLRSFDWMRFELAITK